MRNLVENYVRETSFEHLLSLCSLQIQDDHIPRFCSRLISRHDATSSLACAFAYAEFPSVEDLLFFNACLNDFRPMIVRFCLEGKVKNAIAKHLRDHGLLLYTQEDRKKDASSHWKLRKDLLNRLCEEQIASPDKWNEVVEFMLLETFLLHFRLQCADKSQPNCEILFTRESISATPQWSDDDHAEAIVEERPSKRVSLFSYSSSWLSDCRGSSQRTLS